VRPTLDDVFVDKTGHHLEREEGAPEGEGANEPESEAAPA